MNIKKSFRIIKNEIRWQWKTYKIWYWNLNIKQKIIKEIKHKKKWWKYKLTGEC